MTEIYIAEFWKNFSIIQKKTKKVYILTEEYDEQLRSFIQPIKEQRDALEHITRALSLYYSYDNAEDITPEDNDRIKRNLNSAIGHIFRAFFDSADVLSIELRKKLSLAIEKYSYEQIIKVYPNYEHDRKVLIELPYMFASFREQKDISNSVEEIISKVNLYYTQLENLFNIYKNFMLNVYPELKANFLN